MGKTKKKVLFTMKGFTYMILAFCGFCHAVLEDEMCPRRHHALLIALLPLHRGFDCREWVQKGVQQKVALESTIAEINTENELQIGLKILDTCSNREKAVQSAMRAVAFAKKRCSKFPIFLGFLGPDDEESLRAILGIFKYPQVAPVTTMSFQHSAINVDIINIEERARRISSFLKYLNWYSFILIFTSDSVSSELGEYLLESNDFCLTNSVLRMPSFGSGIINRAGINKLRRATDGVQSVRIVILTDDIAVMDYFTDYVEEEWVGSEYVIYSRTSGILPWRPSRRMPRNMIILQEVPKSQLIITDFEDTLRNSSLWSAYVNHLGIVNCPGCKSKKIMVDTTVVPYVYSLHLISKALRMATRKKCDQALICDSLKKMNPQEWKNILEDTVTSVHSHKIGFYMQLPTQIYIIDPRENITDKIGYIETEVIIERPGVLKRLNRTKTKQCLVDMYEYELEPDENQSTTSEREENAKDTIADEEKIPLDFGYNELMMTVIGFPIGLLVLVAFTIFCVYKSLRGSSDNPRKSNLSTDSGVEDYN